MHSDGPALWPDRYDVQSLTLTKQTIGSRYFAALYQQRPAPAEGAILKRDWWRHWREPLPAFDWMLQTWDTAFKTGKENDWSVCLTLAVAGSNLYLLDLWRDRVEFPQLERAVRDQFTKWQPDEIVVEDAASGQSLIQQLGRDASDDGPFPSSPLPIVAFRPDRDKVARAHATSPYLESGRLHVPASAPWVDGFVHECAVFPGGLHDDQVDTLTMGVLRVADRLGHVRGMDALMLTAFADLPS